MKRKLINGIVHLLRLPIYLYRHKLNSKLLCLNSIYRDHTLHIDKAIVCYKNELRFYDPTDYIIDVGAYDGGTCLYFRKFLPHNPIIAFEPNPEIFRIAQEKCKNKNITILPYVVALSNGNTKLHITKNAPSASILSTNRKDELFEIQKSFNVPSITLDSCVDYIQNRNVGILKMDIQGAERIALENGKQLLKQTKFLVLEVSNHNIYKNACAYYEVDELLRKENFTLIDWIPSLYGFDLSEPEDILKFQAIEWNTIYLNKTFLKR